MLVHRFLDSPIGTLALYSSPLGLRYLAFADVEKVEFDSTEDIHSAAQAAGELDAYFAGTLYEFKCAVDVPGTNFQTTAQRSLAGIPYGETRTYAQLAQTAGNAAAIRAVGTACARNPVPLIWPCHRVIRSDGTWGAYRGGPEAKSWLLKFEAEQLAGNPSPSPSV